MACSLGIDIGTTATKVALLDSSSSRVVARSRPATLDSPAEGFAQARPEQWWANVCALVPEVLAEAGVAASAVEAVATTGMVPAVLTVGADGVVGPGILQNDARAVVEVNELKVELSELDLVTLTGSPLSQQSVAPTLRWLQRHEPDRWKATTAVAGSYDWLLSRLGARPHVEWNWALESGLFDLDGHHVAEVVRAGRAEGLLLPVERCGSVVGAVTREAAAATGLRDGTPLVVGGADHVLSAASAGLHHPGDTLVKLGGAGDILIVAPQPVADARIYLDAHPVPGLWLPNGCMATSGSLLRWLQGVVGGTSLAEFDIEAASAAPAGLLCLPYFLGEKSPLHDPDLRGAVVGLQLSHGRGDLHRAAMEATAFGFRQHLDVFEELGLRVGRILVTNGGSGSKLWKSIVADVFGRDLVPVEGHPGASFGAAIAAAMGVGALDSWVDAAGHLSYGEPVMADPERHETYGWAYELWLRLGAALEEISHELARRTRT